MVEERCDKCSAINSSPYTIIALVGLAVAVVLLVSVWYKRSNSNMDGESTPQEQLTDNPLQIETSEVQAARSSLSRTANKTIQRSDDAMMLLRVMYQPFRILVGYGQVVNQIGLVLDIEYPPMIKRMFSFLSPFAMNLKSILQLDCLGDIQFYEEWTVRIFVIPLMMVAIVAARYAYAKRSSSSSSTDAASRFHADLFVIIFLIYPGVCNEAFSMYNCRALDGDLTVLHMDYRIDCSSTVHSFYQLVAGAVIGVFSVGIPLGMVVLMLMRMADYEASTDSQRFVARRVADELRMDDAVAADAIRDVSTGREYSFLVNAYKPRYYFWEGIDMIRKLALVGMLVVAGRGSVAQLFLAVCVSCASLVAQVTLSPYKHREDNIFKACVEVHIFLVVTIALVLKCLVGVGTLEGEELFGPQLYDGLLVTSFIVLLPIGFIWTVLAKRSMMRESLQERSETGGRDAAESTRAKQRAVKLLQLGLTTNDDMRLLQSYFNRLENLVNKWSHCFVSYRVASDRDLARRLYDDLSSITLDETGQKLRVYLDQTRLEDGQRWDSGFMEGLSQSWVFVPIVSVGCVQPMMGLSEAEDWCDNVLLEWTAALELHQRGRVKSVLPLLVGSPNDFFADAQAEFGGVSALPSHVSTATMEQVGMHLQETTGSCSVDGLRTLLQQASGQPEPTVQGLVSSMLRFQGVKLSQAGAGSVHSHGHVSADLGDLSECTARVKATVSASLKRFGMEHSSGGQSDGGSPGGGGQSMFGRLGSRLSARSPTGSRGGDGSEGLGVQFGGAGEGVATEGGGELYLATS
jgi:hypothetical protein